MSVLFNNAKFSKPFPWFPFLLPNFFLTEVNPDLPIPTEYVLTIMGMAVLGRFMMTMAMNVGIQYPVEVLPTVARGSGNGLIHTLGNISAFISPYIVYLVSIAESLFV